MFAKTEWFRLTRTGRGVAPSGWTGWAYMVVWAGLITLPALLLANRPGQQTEALIWLAIMGGLFFWERHNLSRHLRGERSPGSRTPTVTASPMNTVRTGPGAAMHNSPTPHSANDVFYIGDDNQPSAGEEYVFRLRR